MSKINSKFLLIGIVALIITISISTFMMMDESTSPITPSTNGNSYLDEKDILEAMSCPELIERNKSGEPYESKEIRLLAREKTLDCSDVEEVLSIHASCEDLYERYHSGMPYLFEEHKLQTENKLKKCERDGYAQTNLNKIHHLCESNNEYVYEEFGVHVQFDNGTHSIDNQICEWEIK